MEQISEKDFSSIQTKLVWDKAIEKAGVNDIGQQYEYCLIWWRTFKENVVRKKLVLVTDLENDYGVIWPLMSRRQWMLNGLYAIGQIDGFITDYAVPVCTNTDIFINHLDRLVRFLKNENIKWSFIKFNIPRWTRLLPERNIKIKEKVGNNFHFFIKEFDKYSVIDLAPDFKAYVISIGIKTRSDIRRYLKIYGSYNFRFEILEGADIFDHCTELVKLNLENWSIFKDSTLNLDFFIDYIKHSVNTPNGRLIMPALFYEDKVIASVLGFLGNTHCFLHTAGISRKKIHSLAPGITLYVLLIQNLIERGIKTLDLSPGIEDYKIRLGARIESVTQLVIYRNYSIKLFYKTGLLFKRLSQIVKDGTNQLMTIILS